MSQTVDPGRTYSADEVTRATRAGAEELYGRDTLAASILAGAIAMKLVAGTAPEAGSVPEAIDWNAPPDYTLRAISASSTREWADLIADGASRLTKSIASYCNHLALKPDEAKKQDIAEPNDFC